MNIVPATSAQDLEQVRILFGEYAGLVAEALCFQNFDRELEALPGQYALPKLAPAIALYRDLGFRETGPYLACPTPGAICFELKVS